MIKQSSAIPDVVLLEPKIFSDDRGYFFESFNQLRFEELINNGIQFVQDNHSFSLKNVLRGLHYQNERPQGKLIRVISGEIFDVAIDLRSGSSYYGQWVSAYLSAKNHRQLWIPAGFAHGFLTLSDSAEVLYKTTDYYLPQAERCIRWDDPDLAIRWPLQPNIQPIISEKDLLGQSFKSLKRVK